MSQTVLAELESYNHILQELNIAFTQTTTDSKDSGGKYLFIDDKKKIDLTRLDYLALGDCPDIREIMIDSINNYDIGCPAAQVVLQTGAIQNLEKELGSLHNMKESITFLSGYSTNNNVIALLGLRFHTPHIQYYLRKIGMSKILKASRTVFFVDEETHYSVFYAIKQARALAGSNCIAYTYQSGNYEELNEKLKSFEKKGHKDNILKIIVSDTVSSTTGRIFDVGKLCDIANKFDALLYLDEAHAVGAIGEQGGGVSSLYEEYEQNKDRIIVMGTLTKAITQLGGYTAFNHPYLTSYIKLLSPQYIFSTTVPPWMAVAIKKMLQLIKGDLGKQKRFMLHTQSENLRSYLIENDFNILRSNTQIIPVLIKDDKKAAEVQQFLLDNGLITSLFIYPAVPHQSAIIRFSICADITQEDIEIITKLMVAARDKFRF
jgi:7-keto-8-aminopelargonate synthetase-like enzyme